MKRFYATASVLQIHHAFQVKSECSKTLHSAINKLVIKSEITWIMVDSKKGVVIQKTRNSCTYDVGEGRYRILKKEVNFFLYKIQMKQSLHEMRMTYKRVS